MTALSIAPRMEESLQGCQAAEQAQCEYCGKRLTFLRRLSDDRFCADEHRRLWRLERLVRALEDE